MFFSYAINMTSIRPYINTRKNAELIKKKLICLFTLYKSLNNWSTCRHETLHSSKIKFSKSPKMRQYSFVPLRVVRIPRPQEFASPDLHVFHYLKSLPPQSPKVLSWLESLIAFVWYCLGCLLRGGSCFYLKLEHSNWGYGGRRGEKRKGRTVGRRIQENWKKSQLQRRENKGKEMKIVSTERRRQGNIEVKKLRRGKKLKNKKHNQM